MNAPNPKYPNYKTVGWDLQVGKFVITNHGNGDISIDDRETCMTATFDAKHLANLIELLCLSQHRRPI